MKIYNFETEQFGISDVGIHLLRSRYNYETYEFKDIDQITVVRGKQVYNWIVLFTLGILFLLVQRDI